MICYLALPLSPVIAERTPENWWIAAALLAAELALLWLLWLRRPLLRHLALYLALVPVPAGLMYLLTPNALDDGWRLIPVLVAHVAFGLAAAWVIAGHPGVFQWALAMSGIATVAMLWTEPYPGGPEWRYYSMTGSFILAGMTPFLSACFAAVRNGVVRQAEFWSALNVGVYFGVNVVANAQGRFPWMTDWTDWQGLKLAVHLGNALAWIAIILLTRGVLPPAPRVPSRT